MPRVSKETEYKVYNRDNWQCVHCGTTQGLSIQHRKNAGMGGSKKAHTPANLTILCVISNQLLESDARFAQIGRLYGWKLKSHENPLKEPLYDMNTDRWYLLDDEGNRTPHKSIGQIEEDTPF